ncbi:KH domain-containing protein [Rubrobacter tropicus]|uniref:RNA-binding protein KhpB n=1 Tax=Rubrobacter tropicus TaxID=2653851 RepID=A0A6G8QEM3_9ACTN|nr:RNA-binding cell elongation regulator Jag/EloR [Rubrobacter tropicus]QIN84954.1 KH domain-containing protein [Rubrobacter tropicus]
MTERREFYAATVEEAVARAAQDLGVNEEDVSYRVVDSGNSGFLGIGARDARIEVDTPARDAGVDEPDLGPTVFPDSTETAPEETVEDPAAAPEEATTGPGLAEIFGEQEGAAPEKVPQELIDSTEELVVSLLEAMGFEARVDVYDAGGYVAVDVAPDNTALFIGQKGETIDALQYLVNAGVNNNRSSRARIVLDAEGYRQRRVEALQGMAHRTARKAMREDRTVELPPMNPSERRVVHLFLRDNPGVTTESEGTGDSRRVRVSPV